MQDNEILICFGVGEGWRVFYIACCFSLGKILKNH